MQTVKIKVKDNYPIDADSEFPAEDWEIALRGRVFVANKSTLGNGAVWLEAGNGETAYLFEEEYDIVG